jgi:hypothetical protein
MNNQWPDDTLKDKKVKDVFGVPTQLNFGVTDSTTLFQVVNTPDKSHLTDGDNRALASDLISAYLDAHKKGMNFPYKQLDIISMWKLVFKGETYLTGWTSTTVRNFLNVLVSGTGI